MHGLNDNLVMIKYYLNQVQHYNGNIGYFLSNVIGPTIDELALFDRQVLSLRNNVKLVGITKYYARLQDQYYKLS